MVDYFKTMREEGRAITRLGRERGVTLVELMMVIAITGVLLTLSASALRHFWLVHSLVGAQSQVVTQLREDHERSISQSHPLVYGERFLKGTSKWGTVLYNVTTGACSAVNSKSFDAGVIVDSSSSFPDVTGTAACRNAAPNPSPNYIVVLFYARGSASPGSLTVRQPVLGRTRMVNVAAVTGRVSTP